MFCLKESTLSQLIQRFFKKGFFQLDIFRQILLTEQFLHQNIQSQYLCSFKTHNYIYFVYNVMYILYI